MITARWIGLHRYVISAAIKPHCENKNKESSLNPCYCDIVWEKCWERKDRESENVNCTTALENRPSWDIFIATATSCHISIGWIVDAGHSSCHLPNAHPIFLTLSEFYLRLSSVTRPRQQPSLNLTGLTVQHKTTVVEPGPKISIYFSHTGHLFRCPNFAAIKWEEKKQCPGWQFHWTEILCFNAKSKAADSFFVCLHDSGRSESSRATKSNSSDWVNVKCCYTLVTCNTNLLFCYGFIAKQLSIK